MSHWDYIQIHDRRLKRHTVSIAAHESPPSPGDGQVMLDVADDEGTATLYLSPDEAKELAKLLWEAGHRAEWYAITRRTL